MEKKGLFHIYCGDGKGKTSAAVGLAVRAAGSGMKVLFTQLMKSGNSSELAELEKLENIKVLRGPAVRGFSWNMSDEAKNALCAETKAFLDDLRPKLAEYDMLVIDECCSAVTKGFMPLGSFLEFIASRPEGLELVITGREPPEEIVAAADYVSEIRKIKHPFDSGIKARRGIEF